MQDIIHVNAVPSFLVSKILKNAVTLVCMLLESYPLQIRMLRMKRGRLKLNKKYTKKVYLFAKG